MDISLDALKLGLEDCKVQPHRQKYLLERWDKYQSELGPYLSRYTRGWKNGEWENVSPLQVFKEPDASAFFMMAYCLLSRESRKVYKRKGIPDELWQENIQDINWRLHEAANGELWLDTIPDSINWHGTIQLGFNVKLGRLQFGPLASPDDFPGLGIRKGDRLLNTHIPAAGRLNIPECEESFQLAKKFYEPRIGTIKAFYCHSWLLNPIFKKYLPDTSNIIRFQNLGIVFPDNDLTTPDTLERVFYYYRENPLTPTPRSSLQWAVQQMLLHREPMNSGIMIRPS